MNNFKIVKTTSGGSIASGSSSQEESLRKYLREIHNSSQDIFTDDEWNLNGLALFLNRQSLTRILYIDSLYKQIIGTTGVICEFGVLYGSTLSLLTNLRGIYEPYNYLRRIIGFDTFSGFTSELTSIEKKLGWKEGDYKVPEGYEEILSDILTAHENNAPISHKKKFELVKGDVTQTFDAWLTRNSGTIISLAIFDMDVYAPTKYVLERVIERMPKGAILAFDEINLPTWPGETEALHEVLGIHNLRLRNHSSNPAQGWCIIE